MAHPITLRVLVVDDEPGMRMGVARGLRSFTVRLAEVADLECGFETVQAETGEEALELIASEKPDIVLLDLKLPGMSGLDVLEALQGGDHDQLVVMITAYATIETAITATKRGAFDVLPKPFDPQELKAVVRKAASHLMARRKAAELQRDKARIRFQFISVLAHELKAPLAALDGYLFILRDRSLGDDVAAYERVVHRCLSRTEGMRKLILDLLDLTRLESEQKRRERETVDVAAVAERAVETVQPLADERGIKVTVRADGDLVMTADAGEIEIVLNNLISNAVKYNRDGGRVDVLLGAADGVVTLRVEDTGIGMTPSERERLFVEFVRIKNDHTKNIMGSGLGLSIVKRIVERYDGEVAVESTPDVGSVFTVSLERSPL